MIDLVGRRAIELEQFALACGACALAAVVVLAQNRTSLDGRTLVLLAVCGVISAASFGSARLAVVSTVLAFVFFATVRRMYPAPDPNSDPAALGPFLIALPLAVQGLRERLHLSVRAYLGWLAVTVPLAGLAVGIAGAFNSLVPLLAAAAISAHNSRLELFVRWLLRASLVAFSYGTLQFFYLFPWDAQWLANSRIRFSAGIPGTSTFRPFATLPAPGTGAVLAAVVIVLAVSELGRRHSSLLLRSCVVGVALPYLAFTQVRSVWIGLVFALIVMLLRRGAGGARRVVVITAAGILLLQVPVIQQTLAPRIQTLQSPTNDVSYNSRLNLLRDVPALLTPFGAGLGTSSAGSRASGDRSLDNGYVVVLAESGVVGLGLLLWMLTVLALRSEPAAYPLLVFLLVINLAGFSLGNVSGLVLFALAGVPLADKKAATPNPLGPVPAGMVPRPS